jgi:stage II sporulation protein D
MLVIPQKATKISNFISRTLPAFLSFLLIFTFTGAQDARANVPSKFVFTGSGYGHGVGMSQIGARGMALESATAVEILQHFYPGTAVAPVSDSEIIRVNLGHQLREGSLSINSPVGSFHIIKGRFAHGEEIPEEAIMASHGKDVTLALTSKGEGIEITRSSKTAKFARLEIAREWTIRWDLDTTILLLRTPARNYQLKYGQINLSSVKNSAANSSNAIGEMEVTSSMRLDDEYLYGLGEVPSSWPEAALDAQAIAGRTFALTKMRTVRAACDCNIYSTTRDQNYVGFSKESEPGFGFRWRAAVDRTKGLAVTLQNRPIQSFFFSSSGGATQNVFDVWGSNFSYLVSRPDGWSLDARINPRYANWNREVSQAAMAKAFELPDLLRYQILERSVTGSVLRIRGVSSSGATKVLTGEVFRSRTALPSTWINLALIPPAQPKEPDREICLETMAGLLAGIGRCELTPE